MKSQTWADEENICHSLHANMDGQEWSLKMLQNIQVPLINNDNCINDTIDDNDDNNNYNDSNDNDYKKQVSTYPSRSSLHWHRLT